MSEDIDMKVKLVYRVIEAFKVILLITVICKFNLASQDKEEFLKIDGKVVFITVGEVYFDFGSKNVVEIGDTVFVMISDAKIDTMIVHSVSDKNSVARSSFDKIKNIKIGSQAYVRKIKKTISSTERRSELVVVKGIDTVNFRKPPEPALSQFTQNREPSIKMNGRISIQNFSLFTSQNIYYHRPGAIVVVNADKFFIDGFKFVVYSKFDYSISRIGDLIDRKRMLSVYQLSLEYQFSNFSISLGRVFPYTGYGTDWTDGIQFLMKSRNITIGFIGGTQPSRWNNSLSLSDPKFSFFVVRGFRGSFLTGNLALSYSKILKNKKLDEDFLSVQNIFRILNFADFHQSVQFDLNDVQNGSKIRKVKLRNLFTSIVFTTTTWLRLGIDFNEYRSAYLFETMKDFPDTLFDKRLRKDIRGRVFIYLPFDANLNLTTTIKFIEGEKQRDQFTSAYLNFDDIFSFGVRTGVSLAKSRFGVIFGKEISFDKSLFNGEINANVSFNSYDYKTSSGEVFTNTVARAGLIFNFGRRLFFIVDVERGWEQNFKRLGIFSEFGYRL
jgi:hypothetical protein